ncbi:MAG: hypothetical protein KA319_12450 [Ferruginibacter sp.]|nr:hypothetical protein [Ferruginibacter sp.]
MTDQLNFAEGEKKKLPIGINVLTILTLIMCAYEIYQNISSFFAGRKGIEELEKAQEQMAQAPAWVRKMAGPEMIEFATKAYESRIPLLIVGLISVGLCIYGALEMRKLKKQGYYLWLIGEILPWIAMFIFVGGIFLKTFMVWFLIFPVLFIILYTLQRKHLVNN